MEDKRKKEQQDWLDRYILNPKQSEAMIKMKLEKLKEQDRFRKIIEEIRKRQR